MSPRPSREVVGDRRRRYDHRPADIRHRARGDGAVEAVREDHDRDGCGELRHYRKVLLALHRALDLRHLFNAHTVGSAIVKNGGDSWSFLTADYVFGHSIERDTGDVVRAAGGKVLGSVKHPLNTADFSSFLLQAQASKAKIIGLANGGGDTINAIKQAGEFGIVAGGQNLAAIVMFISDVHSLGLKLAQGLIITEAYYWDLNDKTRAFGKRFMERVKRMPTMNQAATYSATLHYLKAVQAAGTRDTKTVMAKMRELPVKDAFTDNGSLREDGRMVHSMYLFQVKKPEESKGPWDYYKLLAEVPADQAFRPLKDGGCPLVK